MDGVALMKLAWTTHAKQRRKEMKLTEHRIERAIAEAHTVYPGRDECTCYVDGDLCVVVGPSGEVVTILWDKKEGRWESETTTTEGTTAHG